MIKLLAAIFCPAALASLLVLAPPQKPAGGFAPSALTSVALWLDSKDVLSGSNPSHNTKFASFVDKISGNNFAQATSGNQFTYGAATVNGLDVVVADGAANTYMSSATQYLTTGSAYTIFYTVDITNSLAGSRFVANLKNGNANGSVISVSGTDFSLIQDGLWVGSQWGATNTTSTIYMFEIGYNGGTATTGTNFLARQNGVTLSRLGGNGGNGGTSNALGSDIVDPSLAMSGYILDFVIQATAATPTEEANMLSYEKAKWGF